MKKETELYGVKHLLIKSKSEMLLFHSQDDYIEFLRILQYKLQMYDIQLIAYTLDTNCAHLVIKENQSYTNTVIQSILKRYIDYYKNIYHTCSPISYDKYSCNLLYTKKLLLQTVRYIHQRVTFDQPSSSLYYKWSSYSFYANENLHDSLYQIARVHTQYIYSLIEPEYPSIGRQIFLSIHHEIEKKTIMDITSNLKFRVKDAKAIVVTTMKLHNIDYSTFLLDTSLRNKVIRRIYSNGYLSITEIADLLHISRHIVGRAVHATSY